MRWLFFDEILEKHVCDSLARALERLGHEVIKTGPVWRGHALPTNRADLHRIFESLEEAMSCDPDVLFVFRASTLAAAHLAWLRARRTRTMVWLPDDPVLYRVYGAVVDHYDVILHGGGEEDLLRFYDRRGHRPGVILPFWADRDRFPFMYRSDKDFEGDFVFYGNCSGPAKGGRYRTMENFSRAHSDRPVAIYGRVDHDPHGWGRGYIDDEATLVDSLCRYKMALNIPQQFADYKGTIYDFWGLTKLGHFDVASRVVQLGSLGLPQVAIGPMRPSRHFPTLVWNANRSEESAGKWHCQETTIATPERLHALSHYGRQQFEMNFTADARAQFLMELLSRRFWDWPVSERCFGYRRGTVADP